MINLFIVGSYFVTGGVVIMWNKGAYQALFQKIDLYFQNKGTLC